MSKRMLIDQSHAEETRVVVLDGNRLEDYDVETATKKQLKGNIYLAKVVRVEPSLQAAFVEYGGNRHGFLAFGEIHPDYYQIPVADRQRLVQMQEEEAEAERLDEERQREQAFAAGRDADAAQAGVAPDAAPDAGDGETGSDGVGEDADDGSASGEDGAEGAERPRPETVGGEDNADEGGGDDRDQRRTSQRLLRHYKIQEVIRRRQILLVQVVKEERGSKGAALTTYISLAGRYSVLMPNSPRGGGVSRKITSAADRKRLKEITTELAIPRGMAMIVRTAGAQRPKPEIKRDCEYLLQLWDDVRDTTMQSVAPALIHEEASLIKRAIRDVYSRDIDEILVDGEEGWRHARTFMRMLMPPDAKKVQLWRENQPLFAKAGVEGMLDGMLLPNVQLRSGGTLVINQAEALVAIDVNSGRSTRERGIEETALRTNLEAADEAARQLRLRDLAGLIVIDFIDMESRRHNAMVERRLKDALRFDRARIQVGSISAFGLLEMSRQRLRPSLAESSFSPCPHCVGTGLLRSTESASLHVLRAVEAAGASRDTAELTAHVATGVAVYILNQKRGWLAEIERRCAMQVAFVVDEQLTGAAFRLVKARVRAPDEIPPAASLPAPMAAEPEIEADDEEIEAQEEPAAGIAEVALPAGATGVADEAAVAEGEKPRRRRRRRRRGRREDETGSPEAAQAGDDEGPDADDEAEDAPGQPDMLPEGDVRIPLLVSGEPMMAEIETASEIASEPAAAIPAVVADEPEPVSAGASSPQSVPAGDASATEAAEEGRPRRSRRGGTRRRRTKADDELALAPAPDAAPAPYAGPTPADPFGGAYDIFEVLERSGGEEVVNPAASAAAAASRPGRKRSDPTAPREAIAAGSVQEAPSPGEPTPSEPEPSSAPALQPTLVGTDGVPPARRGWWRR